MLDTRSSNLTTNFYAHVLYEHSKGSKTTNVDFLPSKSTRGQPSDILFNQNQGSEYRNRQGTVFAIGMVRTGTGAILCTVSDSSLLINIY